ncbi:alpha-1,3-mannosyltransferase CMT1 [Mytilinidion resinicola]|uniref:Alpha-1,3-mannosyltransferase CMT1 n=1 Tax=Mytilinidion resinicola TaxID=574789 RepID=A0A6A6Y165_9PEZI|nr:alpha-1,3-mannosyltransferase CMT1 [Mytilinidion resinicola]KAF2801754.1 alpha-1,3-mannosyltransferase CMT1 [Mytilinidion resinicola]
MNPQDGTFNRLDCPALQGNRYEYLRPSQELVNITSKTPKYFFALDLYDCAHILPRLIGSIVETMRYLGPENCALSIVEGRSVDGTYEVLKLMKENITAIGAEYTFVTNEIDPMAKGGNRIEALATLRNQALKPLLDQPHRYDPDTTIIFLNDIALCTEDILELIHQRIAQQADMTCAMDWTYVGDNPTFYDVWIARGMNGDSFFNIPEDGSWDFAWNLFWNNAPTAERLQTEKPFQVFSCWNGVVSFTAKPLWEKNVRFRVSYEGECFQGEPKLFCKDMWYHGYGKIAVIPSVNVEYSDAMAKRIKELKGYVSRWVDTEDASSKIDWQPSPPEKVKCMRSYPDQTWLPWDEQLAEHGVAP